MTRAANSGDGRDRIWVKWNFNVLVLVSNYILPPGDPCSTDSVNDWNEVAGKTITSADWLSTAIPYDGEKKPEKTMEPLRKCDTTVETKKLDI